MNYNLSILSISSILLFSISILLLLGQMEQQQVFTQETAQSSSLWSNATAMPTPRTEVTSAIIEEDIYVIGGFDKSGRVLNIVEVYNIKNDSWRTVAPLPQPLHHTAASSFGGKIYVIGGYSDNNWAPSDKLFIYDQNNDTWTEGQSMPTPRGALTSVIIDEIIYAIGGEGENGILSINEAYNLKTNDWISKSSMPTARHHTASAVVDGNAYVIGGRIHGISPITNVNVNEMYDPKLDKWITLESMPSKRSGISAAAAAATNNNTAIFVFGGEDITKTYNNNEKYDVKSNKWESLEPMPTARHGLTSVSVNDDKIYVIGGGPKPGLSVSGVNEIFNIR
ncbi:MAG: galactose oxidase [Nitrososphaeraceae archaeon]|nr:galactose oxidase [Nitrososphaeraceae archaeon]